MLQEQVLMALGRPRLDLVPSLDEREWIYHVNDEEVFVGFDDAGRMSGIDAGRRARRAVVYEEPTAGSARVLEGRAGNTGPASVL